MLMRCAFLALLTGVLGVESQCWGAREITFGGAFFSETFPLTGKPNNVTVGYRAFYDIELVNRGAVAQTGTVELVPSSRFGLDATSGITQRKVRLSLCTGNVNQTRLSDLVNPSSPILLPSAPAVWGVLPNSSTTLRIIARFWGFSDVPTRQFITTFGPVVKIKVNEDRGVVQAIPFLFFANPNGQNCDGSTDAVVDLLPPPSNTSYPTHPINGGRPF